MSDANMYFIDFLLCAFAARNSCFFITDGRFSSRLCALTLCFFSTLTWLSGNYKISSPVSFKTADHRPGPVSFPYEQPGGGHARSAPAAVEDEGFSPGEMFLSGQFAVGITEGACDMT